MANSKGMILQLIIIVSVTIMNVVILRNVTSQKFIITDAVSRIEEQAVREKKRYGCREEDDRGHIYDTLVNIKVHGVTYQKTVALTIFVAIQFLPHDVSLFFFYGHVICILLLASTVLHVHWFLQPLVS
jgi:hypothetical protein